MICSCFPFARKIPVRKRREQRLLAKDNKRRLNRFVNSPAPNVSKMRPKMRDIKLSFSGSGFDFFAVPTLFNVKKFCLITLQKSDLRKRNGVQEAAGSTPVTPTNENSHHSVMAVFSFRRKGTGGKFKFVTDLPDIVLTCALQQNRQTKARKFANFHYSSGKQNVV